ncbi:hypothetical protein H8S90_03645 [Olivibacter sp. SDN3]|uniref:hypothetical protein n=1 Tax=Olivibacter sp. SDN3 TaxID=2764720 RepID=UPI0016519089|nr:hypothetical protein [Olivibacter sp. SDN3]QNL50703.1 hypothetical protein H8S90_03645 [Olivibacter sp. SDN3]
MMKTTKITNLNELHAEIVRLKLLKTEQEAYLGDQFALLRDKVNKPFQMVQNVFSFFPMGKGNIADKFSKKQGFREDWLTKTLRIGLPFLLNRIFFRKAGYFKRLMLGLVSTQAAGFLNKDRLAQGIDAITSWLKKKPKNGVSSPVATGRKKNRNDYNFGIPPDSETY